MNHMDMDASSDPFGTQPRRPGRGLTIAGLVIIILALVLGLVSGGVVLWGFAGLDFDQFAITEATVPGTVEFEAEQPGNYFLAVPEARRFTPRDELNLELRSLDTGQTVPLGQWEIYGETVDDFADPEMIPFRLEEAGRYALDVRAGEGIEVADEHEAVVGRIPTDMVGRMAVAAITAFCGGGLTVLLLIVGVIILVIGLTRK